MAQMKNIFAWLGEKSEKPIIENAEKHIEETFKTVSYFADAMKAYITGDVTAKAEAIENVRESEHQADILKAKMIDQISESLLIPPDREDLMHFVKTLDKIADWTQGSARLLAFIEDKLPESVTHNMSAASALIVSSVAKLRESLMAFLNNDIKTALARVDDIDYLEHEADDRKKDLIEAILRAKLEPNNLIITFHLADYMEGVTDKINTAADFIKSIAIKNNK
jgi:predicted phosphate transport protein (TIGR00153 family)